MPARTPPTTKKRVVNKLPARNATSNAGRVPGSRDAGLRKKAAPPPRTSGKKGRTT